MALRGRPAHLPAHVYAKLEADLAPEGILNGLLDACSAASDATQVEHAMETYCKGKELCGPPLVLEVNEQLGHVKPEQRTINHIANELGMDPMQIGELVRGLAGEGTRTEIDLASEWFKNEIVDGLGSSLTIARRPAWLFRVPDRRADPFESDTGCLPWSLGLPLWAKTPKNTPPHAAVDCLGYRVRAEYVNARRPTAVDAGYEGISYYWEPGGVTVPHSHGPRECSSGWEEIVAEPPLLANIEQPIVRFKSRTV